jgi:hypothetical protein
MPQLLRTIRLDASDTIVFERAAAAGEWAVPGTFMFWDDDAPALAGRRRQAFRAGFLGLSSFGWSTLAVVVEASAAERATAIASLAAHLLAEHGAPDQAAAAAAAEDEIAFAESLARHPPQTLVALTRAVTVDGAISEQFRTFHAADAARATAMPCSAGAFAVIEDEAEGSGEDAFDMAALVAADAEAAKS